MCECLTGIFTTSGLKIQRAGGCDSGSHISQHETNSLILADGATELLPLICIFSSQFQSGFSHAHRTRRQTKSAGIQR